MRFIFSHSALREGWDNPNVFVIGMLKHSDNTISRRQEVGRGLRLSVNQNGERMDDPATVHEINVLTVVASESYKDFVAGLQKEIVSDRFRPGPRGRRGLLHRQGAKDGDRRRSGHAAVGEADLHATSSRTITRTRRQDHAGIPRGQEGGELAACRQNWPPCRAGLPAHG